MNARAWFYSQPGFHDRILERAAEEDMIHGTGRLGVVDAETVPTALATAEKLLPYLAVLNDLGWPGLSERDRTDISNLRADLEAAFSRVIR